MTYGQSAASGACAGRAPASPGCAWQKQYSGNCTPASRTAMAGARPALDPARPRPAGYGLPILRPVAAAEPGQSVLVRVRMRRMDEFVTSIPNLAKAYCATVLDVQVSESRS